ncbi:endoglucanase [Butyrivibrio fibrisolvens DSM 3071]|uniref:Endoglucanase n=2 Tax=Butyrivibrio fibrisolvens TaxID=831 RepID=A0A1M6B4H7_BUTFI|nr:endoglucanase [Butyrivibrio fibrisolvens DSM 3071]
MWTHMKRGSAGVALISCIALVSGCAESAPSINPITETIQEDALVTPDPALSTAVSVQSISPCILVDQNGYRTGASKLVLFNWKEQDRELLPSIFEIKRVSDDVTVFTASITWPDDGNVGNGYFTDFQTDGEYYIYADGMGDSCSFAIGDNVYDTIYESSLRQYYLNRCGVALTQEYAGDDARGICHSDLATLESNSSVTLDITGGWHLDSNADRDVETGCLIIDNLLLAYEMNPDVFKTDSGIPESGDDVPDMLDEVRYEAEWLLKMQDSKTGGVYASALTNAKPGQNLSMAEVLVTDITPEATVSFAATLAWCSYVYADIDSAFSEKCLKASKKAYEAASSMGALGAYDASFLAAAQLYRLTGEKTYENGLTTYFKTSSFESDFIMKDCIFMGGICYLKTTQPVNRDVCSKIMGALISEAETISVASKKSDYMVSTGNYDDVVTILRNMRCLTVTNHILYSQEYVEIIENHAHFLLGRGPEGANLATDTTEYTYKDSGSGKGILYDPILDAEFLILMSAIM